MLQLLEVDTENSPFNLKPKHVTICFNSVNFLTLIEAGSRNQILNQIFALKIHKKRFFHEFLDKYPHGIGASRQCRVQF